MNIKWYGHSCFRIRFKSGISILTDPYSPGTTLYSTNFEKTDIITLSHNHKDHNFVPPHYGGTVFSNPGDYSFRDISIKGISSFHDSRKGEDRGDNVIFKFSSKNESIVHLGDIGHVLCDVTLTDIGNVDVLLVPVGGTYTVGPDDAMRIVEQVKPRIVIPMHYKTDRLTFPILPADNFIRILKMENTRIDSCESDTEGLKGMVIFNNYVQEEK